MTQDQSERKSLLIQIHQGKKYLQMSDEIYQALIHGIAGETSCKFLSIQDLKKVLQAMKKQGFKVQRFSPKSRDKEKKTPIDKIRALWIELYKSGKVQQRGEEALNHWLEGMFGNSRIEWLTKNQQSKAIEALKKWLER